MELEVRIAELAHLGAIETFDFHLRRNADRRNQIADLKPGISHGEAEDSHDACIDDLHEELRNITVKQAAHAVGAVELDELIAHDAVPARAVLPGGEDTDRDDAPQTVHAVDRNRGRYLRDRKSTR